MATTSVAAAPRPALASPVEPRWADSPYHRPVGPMLVDAEDAQRYEARVEGELAGFIAYRARGSRIALVHTEVLPAHEGRGIARQLVRFALDDARRRGLRVVATCPYVRAYVERHPETHDIVVGMAPA